MNQSTNPLISVVIPTYNRCEATCQCIDSILANTFKDYEIIVVDDASTDDTGKAIRERYLATHGNIRYVRNSTNLMVSGSREAGMEQARGDWFLFLDNDNLVLPDMLEKLVDCARRHQELGLVGALSYNAFDQSIWTLGAEMNWWTGRYREWLTDKYRGKRFRLEEIDQLALPECCATIANAPNAVMVRRDVAEMVGGYNTAYRMCYEDTDFCLRVTQAGISAAICTGARTKHMHFSSKKGHDILRRLGIHAPLQTFLLTRNRSWLMKYFAPWYGKITYFALFVHIPGLYYALQALLHGRPDCALAAIKGTWTGIFTSPPPPPGDGASCSRGKGGGRSSQACACRSGRDSRSST